MDVDSLSRVPHSELEKSDVGILNYACTEIKKNFYNWTIQSLPSAIIASSRDTTSGNTFRKQEWFYKSPTRDIGLLFLEFSMTVFRI